MNLYPQQRVSPSIILARAVLKIRHGSEQTTGCSQSTVMAMESSTTAQKSFLLVTALPTFKVSRPTMTAIVTACSPQPTIASHYSAYGRMRTAMALPTLVNIAAFRMQASSASALSPTALPIRRPMATLALPGNRHTPSPTGRPGWWRMPPLQLRLHNRLQARHRTSFAPAT